MKKDVEQNLIQACLNNERWAQKELYNIHYSKLMGICLRYSNSYFDAQDILHDGFIKIYKNVHKYKIGTSLESWMKRIMVNTAIDYYRKMVRLRTEDIEEAFDLSSKEVDAISRLSEMEVLECVQKLTPAYRLVFNLFVIEGYPHKEIAKQLNITESTSRSNLVKARRKLKDILNNR